MTQHICTSTETRCWHEANGALVLSLEKPRPRISKDVLDSIERAIDAAEKNFATVVISSGADFAFGANLSDAFEAVSQGRPEVLDAALSNYQRVMLRLRHARVPTVAAVRGVAISGGCELLMHCARVVAHPNSRIGLAEASVGVVPGGGGLKEFARRAAASNDLSQAIIHAFEVVAPSKISTTALEAQQLGFLTSLDHVSATDPLAEAIELGRALHTAGHAPPPQNPIFRVAGDDTLQQLHRAQRALFEDGKLTAHQFKVNMCVANVLCGGDAQAGVRSEAEVLALERKNLIALAQTPLTQARFAHLRNTGKALMN